MKALIISSLLALSPAAFADQSPFVKSSSKIAWEGKKVVGGAHQGTLSIKDGYLKVSDKKPVEARVTVDMTSIVNTDLKDPTWNKKLVDHLHSDDFFSTAKFPHATIVVSKFTKKSSDRYTMSGQLTIKGITKPVAFEGRLIGGKGPITALEAALEFDRTEFNVRYGSGKFFDNLGDKMISDKVTVDVKLKLKSPIKLAAQ